MVSTMSIYIGTRATRERGNEVQMFLFKRMNKMIHTGNNGRGPGGPRLPSDGAVTPMTVGLNIPAVGSGKTTCSKSAKRIIPVPYRIGLNHTI